MTEEVNAETGLPAVKHNRLSPRNRITIAHWVILQETGDRVPGNESVYQRENLCLSRQSRHIHNFVHKVIKDLDVLLGSILSLSDKLPFQTGHGKTKKNATRQKY